MSKIIAGKYKGRKIKISNLRNVRPTLAKVKKSIFQILEPFKDKKILDLYSGTGSIGLEFLSRGAREVVMVEKSRKLTSLLKQNISNIHLEDNYQIICNDVMRFLKINENKFDIIFADPPYDSIDFFKLKDSIDSSLVKNGTFCMEMNKQKINDLMIDIRVYGNSQVAIWTK